VERDSFVNNSNRQLAETMNSNRLLAILVVGGSLGLLGCKPSETTITGQAFIVTKGVNNVKLGAVEILLIEKQPVADYLRQRQGMIDAQIEAGQRALDDALHAVETAKTNAAAASTAFH
jgi:hypothetical protein